MSSTPQETDDGFSRLETEVVLVESNIADDEVSAQFLAFRMKLGDWHRGGCEMGQFPYYHDVNAGDRIHVIKEIYHTPVPTHLNLLQDEYHRRLPRVEVLFRWLTSCYSRRYLLGIHFLKRVVTVEELSTLLDLDHGMHVFIILRLLRDLDSPLLTLVPAKFLVRPTVLQDEEILVALDDMIGHSNMTLQDHAYDILSTLHTTHAKWTALHKLAVARDNIGVSSNLLMEITTRTFSDITPGLSSKLFDVFYGGWDKSKIDEFFSISYSIRLADSKPAAPGLFPSFPFDRNPTYNKHKSYSLDYVGGSVLDAKKHDGPLSAVPRTTFETFTSNPRPTPKLTYPVITTQTDGPRPFPFKAPVPTPKPTSSTIYTKEDHEIPTFLHYGVYDFGDDIVPFRDTSDALRAKEEQYLSDMSKFTTLSELFEQHSAHMTGIPSLRQMTTPRSSSTSTSTSTTTHHHPTDKKESKETVPAAKKPGILGYDDKQIKMYEAEEKFPEDYVTKPEEICVVCLEFRRSCLFVPCEHITCCLNCSLQILTSNNPACPVCRAVPNTVYRTKWA